MSRALRLGQGQRRPTGIIIPNSEENRRQRDDEVDPTDPRGKRLMFRKKKKKKNKHSMDTLTTWTRTLIPIPLIEEKEAQ